MRHNFHGVSMEVPEAWTNRSLALFVSPPAKRKPLLLPTLNRQRQAPEMSVSVTSPEAVTEGATADSELGRTLERMQKIEHVTVESRGSHEGEGQTIASAVCLSKAADGLSVRQLVAVVCDGQVAVSFSGSAAAADFAQVRDALWGVVSSIELT